MSQRVQRGVDALADLPVRVVVTGGFGAHGGASDAADEIERVAVSG